MNHAINCYRLKGKFGIQYHNAGSGFTVYTVNSDSLDSPKLLKMDLLSIKKLNIPVPERKERSGISAAIRCRNSKSFGCPSSNIILREQMR